jgi:hypothetical protein
MAPRSFVATCFEISSNSVSLTLLRWEELRIRKPVAASNVVLRAPGALSDLGEDVVVGLGVGAQILLNAHPLGGQDAISGGLLQADDQLCRRQVILGDGAESEETDALQVFLRPLEILIAGGNQRIGQAQGGGAIGKAGNRRVAER